MRRRIDPRGILQPEIRTSPSDNTIDISIPGVKNPNAVANLLVAGQLQSFDFYKCLTPVSTRSLYVAAPNPSLYDMLRSAKKQIPTGHAGRLGALLREGAPQPGQGQRHRLADRAAAKAGAGRHPSQGQAGRDGVAAGAGGHGRRELHLVLPRGAGARDGLVPVPDARPRTRRS